VDGARSNRRLDVNYRGFSADTTEEEARRLFVQRFGAEPVEVFRHSVVLVGPVPVPEA